MSCPRPGFRHPLSSIGDPPEHREWTPEGDIYEPDIANTAQINAFVTVDSGTQRRTTIGPGTFAMAHSHFGHDCQVGADCEIAPHASVGGWCEIGDNVRIGMGATIRNRVKVGDGARVGMGAVVIKDVPAGQIWAGNPARPLHEYVPEPDHDPWMEWYESWHQPNPAREYLESLERR